LYEEKGKTPPSPFKTSQAIIYFERRSFIPGKKCLHKKNEGGRNDIKRKLKA
jgi:hypothetical protein